MWCYCIRNIQNPFTCACLGHTIGWPRVTGPSVHAAIAQEVREMMELYVPLISWILVLDNYKDKVGKH